MPQSVLIDSLGENWEFPDEATPAQITDAIGRELGKRTDAFAKTVSEPRQLSSNPYERTAAVPPVATQGELGMIDTEPKMGQPVLGFGLQGATDVQSQIEDAKAAFALPGNILQKAGNVARAIPADVAMSLSENENTAPNLRAAIAGREMPIDSKLHEAALESQGAATLANVGQGLAASAPLLALAGLPGWAGRLVAGGFGADMILHAPQLFKDYAEEINKPESEQDPNKIAQLRAGIIQTFAFAPLTGAHALRMKPSTLNPKFDLIEGFAKGQREGGFVPPETKPAEVINLEQAGAPATAAVVQEIIQPKEANAIQERVTEKIPVAEISSVSPEVGTRVPEPEKAAQAQAQEGQIAPPSLQSIIENTPKEIESQVSNLQRLWPEISDGAARKMILGEPFSDKQQALFDKLPPERQSEINKWFEASDKTAGEFLTRVDVAKLAKRISDAEGPEEISFELVRILQDAAKDKDIRPYLQELFSLATKKVKPEELKQSVQSELVKTYGNDAPEMAEYFFGKSPVPSPEIQGQTQAPTLSKDILTTREPLPVSDVLSEVGGTKPETISQTDVTPGVTEGKPEKVRVGKSPQPFTVLEKLPQSATEKANNEQPVMVRNDKTGQEQVVMEADTQPITVSEQPKAKSKRDINAELKESGLDPSVFPNKASKRAALDRAKALELAGPGGTVPEDIGQQKANIAMLTESMKGMESPSDAPSKVFDAAQAKATLKDGISDTLAGLRAVGAALKTRLIGKPVWTSFKDAIGQRHLELSESAHNAKKFVKEATRAVPDKLTQEAIANWVDAGGDRAILEKALAETKGRYKKGYEKALNLTPEQKVFAENIRNYFEARLNEAQEAGILEDGIEDYIHRIYEKDSPWKQGVLSELRSGVFTGRPALAKQRAFEYDFEAEKAGYKPIKSFIKRIAAYDLSLNKAIADRQMVKALQQIKMPDGRPMVDVGGLGTKVGDVEAGTGTSLIKPGWKPSDPENPVKNRSDYKPKDYPSLRKWKWVSEDEKGNPVMVQGDVLVHPDAIGQLKPIFERSKIREKALGRAALAVSSTIKQTMLDISGFHPVQIMVHGWEHRSFKPVKEIDFTDPDTRGLIKGGLVVGERTPHDLFSEGLTGSSLTRFIPGLGPKLQMYQDWLFNSYIPRLKVNTGLHALERNASRFPKLSKDELYHLTANQMNAAFGELNYEMLGRSKTAQDVLRLALLAPDFLEARGRFAAQATTKYGREQFTALMLGAATMYITARVINKLLDGEYHFEPKNAFSIVHNGRAYSLRTVQGDLLHLWSEPGRFLFNRLNPVYSRTLLEFVTSRDAFGRKRTGLQQLQDFATQAMPISLRGVLNPREQSLWESFINAFGITERRSAASQTISEKAKKWKEKQGIIEQETIYDPDKDQYRGIRQAALFDSPEDVQKEVKKLIESKAKTKTQVREHFELDPRFTNSRANENKFKASLTEDEMAIYRDAIDERKKTKQAVIDALNKIP